MSQTDLSAVKPRSSGIFSLPNHDGHVIEIFHSVNDIPSEKWIACHDPGNLFLSLKYLGTAERSSLPGMQFRYVLIQENDKPAAILYFQMVNLSDAGLGGILNLEEYGGLAASISTRINDILFSPGKDKESFILVCGNLLVSGEHGISAINDEQFKIAVAGIAPIKKIIASTLAHSARLVAFMVKDFYAHHDALAKTILKKDYFLLNTDPEMIFEILPEWKNFEDYKSALSSKYRVRTNSAISKLEPVKKRELTETEIVSYADEIFRLNDEVIRKAPVKLARPSRDYFVNLKKKFGSNYRLHGFFLENQMIAFTSGLWNDLHYEAHYIGIDYRFNLKYALYQNFLYSYISDAIESGSKRLFFGRTALEIKSTAGARPHHLSCYFRFANRVLNTLARPLVSSTGPKDWIPRDPFRLVE